MARRTNWWLEGWQYKDTLGSDGRLRRKLVYTGEYYTFGLDAKGVTKLKAAFITLALLQTVSYILAFTLFETGAARIFIGACMLIVIPLIYLVIGTACIIPVSERLTYRDYRGSVLRIRWTSITVFALSAVGVIGELIHMASPGSLPAKELLWLAAMLLCCLSALCSALLERRFHPSLIPPELK